MLATWEPGIQCTEPRDRRVTRPPHSRRRALEGLASMDQEDLATFRVTVDVAWGGRQDIVEAIAVDVTRRDASAEPVMRARRPLSPVVQHVFFGKLPTARRLVAGGHAREHCTTVV